MKRNISDYIWFDFILPEVNKKYQSIFSQTNKFNEIFRTSIEVLNGDMTKLGSQITKISNQMTNKNTEKDVVAQMEEFLPVKLKYFS